ncbi:hypothetical protein BG60_30380 [Caballeronia zhejiangensis]|uniref:Uncharacterized protein n=1 Tax=Caballeronia zhejiangensis TaxID=871203 RepID=A0A656Q971_9BURK|nr:hypothetical protein BG60_30380 [Caballeronia zhejiangensis]
MPPRSKHRQEAAVPVSACDETDTYAPVAIDIAPAANPAWPVSTRWPCSACEDATPIIRLAVEIMPSFAPRTAARSHPIALIRCGFL